jgi:excinuclease ABC subunit B
MQKAIEETNRRRDKQIAYNQANGIDPQPLRKKIADILDDIVRGEEEELIGGSGRAQSRGKTPVPGMASKSPTAGQHAAELANMPRHDLALLIQQLQDQMHSAAAELQFELAARLRDEVNELKKELRAMTAAGVRG